MLAAWVDGVQSEAIALGDRALHYGDAVFTTIRVHQHRPCWIDAHLQRLQHSCRALRFPEPEWTQLGAQIERAAAIEAACVVKVLLSRGEGARGYAVQGARGRSVVMAYALPAMDETTYTGGVQLRFADWVLSEQPALAGLKHANRLEQVMARSEWSDAAIYDALLCNVSGEVIAATSANVFARFGNEVVTPALDRAGVAGVCRQQVFQSPPPGFSVTVAALPRAKLLGADELFLSNVVRGIVPVRALGDHRFASMAVARLLMRALHPALGLPIVDE
jgi:4-amino-4-deoxychorismate lyase